MLVIKCDQPGQMYVAVQTERYLPGDHSGYGSEVTVQFDQRKPVNAYGWRSANVIGLRREIAEAFVARLLISQKVAFRVFDKYLGYFDYSFDIQNGASAVGKAYATCGAILPTPPID